MSRGAGLVLLFTSLLGACNLFKIDCARPEVLCAALVTDTGGLADYGQAQSAWDDIHRAQADGLVQQANYIESADPRDYAKNLDFFAGQNYDVIVAAGVGLADAALQAADKWPDSVFVGLDQPPAGSVPNFVNIKFPVDQAGFLAGALAANVTATGIIRAACEDSGLFSNWQTCEGFRAGARHEDPFVQVRVLYRDNGSQESLFRDRDWGQAAALDLIADGADIIFGVGGGTGEAALVGAAEAGAWAIGSERDQFYVTRVAQDFLLTSMIHSSSPAVYDLVALIGNGSTIQSTYQGVIEIAPFHLLEDQVSQDARGRLTGIKLQLAQNTLSTGIPSEPP